MTNNFMKWTLISMMALALAACANKPTPVDPNANGGVGNGSGVYGGGAGSNGEYTSTYNDPNYGHRGMADRVIYFDFNSDQLRAESQTVVAAHAKNLSSKPNIGVLLEGHTDDVGSREYNIGLGERRANSVRQLMMTQGVSANQIRVISYGKERPAVAGSDDGARAQNRRVEIVYP